jgi:hypothetical protein
MNRTRTALAGAAIGFVGSVLIAVVGMAAPDPTPPGPPIGPQVPRDEGAGELLLVVVGGTYPTRAEAEAADAAMVFGDLQGYYVVPVAQFQGFQEQVGGPGEFALVSAFRTQEGAEEFLELAATLEIPATLLPERVRSLGGVYAGLGQESHPDGSGPLLGPVPESLP